MSLIVYIYIHYIKIKNFKLPIIEIKILFKQKHNKQVDISFISR